MSVIVGTLAACASQGPVNEAGSTAPPSLPPPVSSAPAGGTQPADLPAPIAQPRSRWVAVRWDELPGWGEDRLFEAWNAWLQSCERPASAWAALCGDIRRLSIGSPQEQQTWIMSRLQPYRVETEQGVAEGLLTGYFEPQFDASRVRRAGFDIPLYRPPAGLGQRKPWYSRQEIDTLPQAQAALQGREIVWLGDAVDALILQIQGSGRVRVQQADGSSRLVRLSFAGSNDQPYRSVARWLQEQGAIRDASWASIKAWAAQNPQRVSEMLWSNPRVVFFREDPLNDANADSGPRGAQGVALTPGRSIAVDPQSIPYGTPVWLASSGATASLQRLVLAQDTGSAITGAVRADYFAGWGTEAGDLAGRLKQPLRLWVLWPRPL